MVCGTLLFNDDCKLLVAILDGSSGFIDRLQEKIEDKDDKIADLTDQLENLMEENKNLKEDIHEYESKELAYRRKILDVFPVNL